MNTITLRAARVNAGLSSEDVEKETGIRKDRLESLEVDCGNIGRDEGIKLLRLYGLPLDGIYLGKEAEYHKRLREKIEARKRERGARFAATI